MTITFPFKLVEKEEVNLIDTTHIDIMMKTAITPKTQILRKNTMI